MAKLILKRKKHSRDSFLRNPRATINFEHGFNARTRFMSYYWARHYFQRFINARA
jgi:hypothetical protein